MSLRPSPSRHARVVVFNVDHPSLLRARRKRLQARGRRRWHEGPEDFETGDWGSGIWRSHRVGGATGSTLCHSSLIPRACAASSILPTIEALNPKLRRAVRTRGHFPNDDAAMELLYLVLNHVAEEWKRPPRE